MPNQTTQTEPSDTVLFDGKCRFCVAQIGLIKRFLASGYRVDFVSLHERHVEHRYPTLTREMLLREIYLIERDGDILSGFPAIRKLLLHAPLAWPIIPFLYLPFAEIPGKYIYRTIARHRYKIAGYQCDEGTCKLP